MILGLYNELYIYNLLYRLLYFGFDPDRLGRSVEMGFCEFGTQEIRLFIRYIRPMPALASHRFRMRRRLAAQIDRALFWLPLNANQKATFIKTVHEGGFWGSFVLYWLWPAARPAILLLYLFVWASQLWLGGCFLTILERHYSHSRTSIMDPWLRWMGLPQNHQWRIRLTLFASSGSLLLMLLERLGCLG